MTTEIRLALEDELQEFEYHREERQRLNDNIALLIVAERDRGATVRSLSARFGVSPSAIQTWTQRGRELRKTGARPVHHRPVSSGSPVAVLPTAVQWVLVAMILLELLLHILGIIGWVSL